MNLRGTTLASLFTVSAALMVPAWSDAEPSEDSVLVVGVTKGKSFDARLTKALSDHFERLGSLRVIPNDLSASERLCTDQDCMEAIAHRTGAQLLVSAVMQQNSPASYYITLGLFDATRRAPFPDSVLCEQCGPNDLLSKLSDTADGLIRKSRESRITKPIPRVAPPVETIAPLSSAAAPTPDNTPAAPVSTIRPIPTLVGEIPETTSEPMAVRRVAASPLPPLPPPPFPPTSLGWSRDRKILAGILGATTLLSLSSAIVLHILDGGPAPDSPSCNVNLNLSKDECVFRNTALYATGYGVAVGSAIGLGFALFWPSGSKTEKPTPSLKLSPPSNSSPSALSMEVH